MPHSSFSRRRFLQSAAALATGVALSPASMVSAQASRARELNLLVWEGYNSPNVLDPFRREFSARVSASTVISDPDAVNRLRAGETRVWDIINLNNPWARQHMHPEGLIVPLEQERFRGFYDEMLPEFQWPHEWSMSLDGKDLVGLPQRFGPFSFVVNTDKVSRATAEDQGFNVFMDPSMKGKYGILTWSDWNIFHMCITAGFTPFRKHTPEEMEAFRKVAEYLFQNARLLSDDHLQMNQALITGTIDAYFTGGTYTASVARYEGFDNIRAITPNSGPIDGKGGIVWIEITSLVNNPNPTPLANSFLEYIMRPDVSYQVAMADGSYNPVAQMGIPSVMEKFSSKDLDAIQFDSLEEELSRCVPFQINPDYAEMLEIYTAARRTR